MWDIQNPACIHHSTSKPTYLSGPCLSLLYMSFVMSSYFCLLAPLTFSDRPNWTPMMGKMPTASTRAMKVHECGRYYFMFVLLKYVWDLLELLCSPTQVFNWNSWDGFHPAMVDSVHASLIDIGIHGCMMLHVYWCVHSYPKSPSFRCFAPSSTSGWSWPAQCIRCGTTQDG